MTLDIWPLPKENPRLRPLQKQRPLRKMVIQSSRLPLRRSRTPRKG